MWDYALVKSLHVGLALTSVGLFALRAGVSVVAASPLQWRWLKWLPHLIDTLLLALGVTLVVITAQWPHQTPWLAAKLLALVVYIGLGSIAIRRGKTPAIRAMAALAALATFAYMAGAAVHHSPLSWWS